MTDFKSIYSVYVNKGALGAFAVEEFAYTIVRTEAR